mmetsp:Transcript_70772/g.124864  ORF Transcript_70772/g.124864 Transcript_70772/m.124864 type:complete len:428 (-) Transcript_70772:188-1471(-)|eukprot:CAMPEP_0197624978 /NCGR_PEP_ID=MMETSP1338-20131121/4462_1 /TAXON_ID=43686 ORGANISM="Pelagodinium beii, Strain RCC1491" /NCGR_SAMPLE_ID=MMETSP1338 /ASSEMBLY_ACC=CAM_ASM_000754 /LENGTH=427 /DNA_ID=CAMNT_0043195257 /DNA_START=140 /DNA_END=1423 /DNA_ORIENTATION=-
MAVTATVSSKDQLGKKGLVRTRTGKVWEISFTVANVIMGPGILTLPYTLVQSGWMGIVDLVLGSAGMLFTGILLGAVLEEVMKHEVAEPTFGLVAELTFGKAFNKLFTALCAGELFLVCIFLLTFHGQSLCAVFNCNAASAIFGTAVLAMVMSFFTKRYLSICSVLGLLFTGISVAAVVGFSSALLPDGVNSGQTFFGKQGLSGGVGTLAATCMCVGDHVIFPSVYTAAGDARTYRRGLAGGFCIFLSCAVVLSSASYAAFGNSIKPVVINNLGLDGFGERDPRVPMWISTACSVALAAKSIVVLPVFMQPVNHLAEKVLAGPLESFAGISRAHSSVLAAALCFALAVLISITYADLIIEIETLTSCFFRSLNVFVIPCLGYCTLCSDRLRGRQCLQVALYSIAFGAATWGGLGTMVSLRSFLGKLS